jgi:hypothetical protein
MVTVDGAGLAYKRPICSGTGHGNIAVSHGGAQQQSPILAISGLTAWRSSMAPARPEQRRGLAQWHGRHQAALSMIQGGGTVTGVSTA